MVIYEAARALVNLKNLKSRDLCPAISGKKQGFNLVSYPWFADMKHRLHVLIINYFVAMMSTTLSDLFNSAAVVPELATPHPEVCRSAHIE